jgi:ribonuclease P protein component
MAFGRGWRRRPAAGYWRRGAPRAASASPPEPAVAVPALGPLPISAPVSPSGGLARLKQRADFLRVAATRRRAVLPGLVLQAAPRPERSAAAPALGVGFTASRKVGNAVTRNRAKRRLRAAAAAILPERGRPGTDYVLIARASTADRPYALLLADLAAALQRVERRRVERDTQLAERRQGAV